MTTRRPSRSMHILLAVATAAVVGGCATNLTVHEVRAVPESPDGVAVNKRIVYGVSATTVEGSGITLSPAESTLVGVDEHRMLSLNICRQPFSTGKLGVELTPAQTLKNVALTSESGAARSLDAGKAIVEAAHPKEEDEKDDEATDDEDGGG